MFLPDTLDDAQHTAIVSCLQVFARRGRALRLERERQQKENRADADQAGRDSLGDSATTKGRFSMSEYNMNRTRAQAVKIARADGRIIGEVRGDVFRKVVSASKHFLRVPDAIANDLAVLAQARDAGARVVEVTDRESGRTYRASFDRIWEKGFAVNCGFGEQIALVLSEWICDGAPTAEQMPLWGAQ